MDPGPFEKLLAELSRAEVRYLVVGGVACAMNGFVRTTEDVDILVDRDAENIRRMLAVLARFGDGHATELNVDDFTDDEGSVRLIEDFPVDIFTRMGGRRYADMLPFRAVHSGVTPIPYVNADGLILLKSKSPRPRDRIDCEELRRLKPPGKDSRST